MSDDERDRFSPRGNYLTQQRILQLERSIAAAEARALERCDQVSRELALLREQQVETLRAIIAGLMDGLRRQPKGDDAP